MSRCGALASRLGLDALSRALSRAAWSESVLDAPMASRVVAEAGAETGADGVRETLELARFVVSHTVAPEDLTYFRRLASRRGAARLASYLEAQQARQPGNLFWDRLALAQAVDAGDWERAGRVAAALPEPLGRLVGGDVAMYRGAAHEAAAQYGRCWRLWHAPGLEARLGFALLRLGDTDGAARWLRAGCVREPWRVQAMLALSDLVLGVGGLRAFPAGRVAVLVYTFEKAQELEATLSSVFASDLGGACVTVLDNGSTDATPAVLSGWLGRVGAGRLRVERLPVNVGAPAARNWLSALEWVREADWTVFLDDDVELPQDWLGRLGAAAALYPGAGVWGAKVVEHGRPWRVQSADVFVCAQAGGEELSDAQPAEPGRLFSLSSVHHESLDRGQFGYARPCAAVTGCCHMFGRGTLLAAGGFDLRFSPSQYDDLDHDIRLLLSGRVPVCQGHLAVRHFKSTGSLGGAGQSQYGVGFANQYKLHGKYAAPDIERAARTADAAAWSDALAKWRALTGG